MMPWLSARLLRPFPLAVAWFVSLAVHYLISDELAINRSNITLAGPFKSSDDTTKGAWIRTSATNKDIIKVQAQGDYLEGFVIENLSLRGNKEGGGSGSDMNIPNTDSHAMMRFRLNNVITTGCAHHGIIIDGEADVIFDGSWRTSPVLTENPIRP
jgi:hypothetical protein